MIENPHDHACKVCGAMPDRDGERVHGKGCYVVSADGGGVDYIDMGDAPSRPIAISARVLTGVGTLQGHGVVVTSSTLPKEVAWHYWCEAQRAAGMTYGPISRGEFDRRAFEDEWAQYGSGASTPIPMFLTCPACGTRHIDEGEFATKPHHTHACQHCGLTWRPAIGPTVGVRFLTGFKNAVLVGPETITDEQILDLRRRMQADLDDDVARALRTACAVALDDKQTVHRWKAARAICAGAWNKLQGDQMKIERETPKPETKGAPARQVECTPCQGLGSIEVTGQRCATCGGSGWVPTGGRP